MQQVFYSDLEKQMEISWDELITDLNRTYHFNTFCYQEDPYSVFKEIIFSLLIGEEIILMDSNFSDQENFKLTGHSSFEEFEQTITNFEKVRSKAELLSRLEDNAERWSITLFTSGTSGLPKKIKHTLKTLTRFVRVSERHYNAIWGYAFNPTHMAGVQVFFQGLQNGNSFVNLFGRSPQMVFESIQKYMVTHVSATPTFYRLLLPSNEKFISVTRISSGGEAFDKSTIEKLNTIFPNAKVTNIYASTEAGTLFATDGNIFSVKDDMIEMIRIENDELLIHSSILGNSEQELEEWYHTGDILEVVSDNPLRFYFKSRKNEMINVGGYKVNPNEVEETIRLIEGVQNVRVFSKSNSVIGNIICCEIEAISELNEAGIRGFLKSHLQEFKIPRIIKFVEKISTTRTGKINRKLE